VHQDCFLSSIVTGFLAVARVTRLGDCFLWTFFEKLLESPKILGYFFSTGKSYVSILTKMDWATLWAIFSQTHPVTLAVACSRKVQSIVSLLFALTSDCRCQTSKDLKGQKIKRFG
jgi:hypothetical protein